MGISAKSVATKAIKTAMALGFVGAMAIGGTVPAAAFYINGPGFHVWVGHHHHPRYYDYYQGPAGGGWNTWNGCPPDYTVQGGVCKPYRGY
jgi:hypothetical protein